MSGGWMAFLEIALVFGAVFGVGFYELWKLRQYSKDSAKRPSDGDGANDQQTRP